MTDLEILNAVDVATPCDASWDDMPGNKKVRHCQLCSKNVYNLAAMTGAEAAAMIRDREGPLCIRLFRRHDGTLINLDCPRGARRVWKSLRSLTRAGGVTVLLLAGCLVMPSVTPKTGIAAPLQSAWSNLIADLHEWLFPTINGPPMTGDMVMGGCPAPTLTPPPPTTAP